MLKITAVVSLMLIVTWSQADSRRHKKNTPSSGDFEPGSTLWAASLSCDSCGSECTSACGTRHFRSCCFNYLRRKRGPEGIKFWSPAQEKNENTKQKLPIYVFENPEPWMNNIASEYKPYSFEDTADNRLQIVYDV